MRIYLTLLAFALLLACKSTPPGGTGHPTPHPLLGTWLNIDMRVEYGADSIMDVPPGEWEARLKIKPIRTTFRADSTLVSEYRNLADSVIMTRPGQWYATGDTVYLFYTDQPVWEPYHFKLKGDTVRFSGHFHFDADTLPDRYTGRQIRAAQ